MLHETMDENAGSIGLHVFKIFDYDSKLLYRFIVSSIPNSSTRKCPTQIDFEI